MPVQTYSHVRVIAFRQPTVAVSSAGATLYGVPPGSVPQTRWFTFSSPHASDLSLIPQQSDLFFRMQRFLNAMAEAQAYLEKRSLDRKNELKIFMAPEFYFRPDNSDKAYTYDEFVAFRRIMTDTLAKDGRFKNWFVVCGSLVWKRRDDIIGLRPSYSWFSGDYFYNTSVTIFLTSKGAGKSVDIDKTATSNIDGIPFTSSSDRLHHLLGRTYEQDRIIEENGIRIGLDICLEHIKGLRKVRSKVISEMTNNKTDVRPHIHLVTACGMPLHNGSTGSRRLGYRARVDGLLNNDENGTNVEGMQMDQVELYRFKKLDGTYNISKVYNSKAESKIKAEVRAKKVLNIPSSHDLHLPLPAGSKSEFWDARPQKIVIYKRKSL